MDDFEFISKKHDHKCSENSEMDFLECFYSDKNQSTCTLYYDTKPVSYSCELINSSNPLTAV